MKLVTTAVQYDSGRFVLDVLVDGFPQGVTVKCCKVLTYGIIIYLTCIIRNSDFFLEVLARSANSGTVRQHFIIAFPSVAVEMENVI
jgi:hypothetical protein